MAGSATQSTEKWKAEALRLGFSACGVARAGRVDERNARAFRQWLARGGNAGMAYMASHEDKRLDPRLLLPGARSVVVVALNYFPRRLLGAESLQFAYYAYGRDYHDVVRDRLRRLLERASAGAPHASKVCCDTVPMLDRYWAWRAGLGWTGKNTSLIIPRAGSFFFLGELVTDLEFDRYGEPMAPLCGTCERCLRACPTGALRAPHRLDAARCLSYLTVENRGAIPPRAAAAMGNCVYGCDRCQQACPHNRLAPPTEVDELAPSDAFLAMRPADWQRLTEEQYRQLFRGTAVKRAKYGGLMRNIRAACGGGEDGSDA